ncbi:MAG: hypothetical protein AB7L13_08170 [Acidimicrobiia bacterium]
MSEFLAPERSSNDPAEAVAVLAHLALNALAAMHAGFETLATCHELERTARGKLLGDLLETINRMERLARGLMRGEPFETLIEADTGSGTQLVDGR